MQWRQKGSQDIWQLEKCNSAEVMAWVPCSLLSAEWSHKQLQLLQSDDLLLFISLFSDVQNLAGSPKVIHGHSGLSWSWCKWLDTHPHITKWRHFCHRKTYHSTNAHFGFLVQTTRFWTILRNGSGSTHDCQDTVWEWLETAFWRTLSASQLPLVRGQGLSMQTMAHNTLFPTGPETTAKLQTVA